MKISTPSTCKKMGFTLVELVVVIVIVGILSALGGLIITNHMEGYGDMRRRAELVDSAESALRRMQRDIRSALPNSVNASNNQKKLTFIHSAAGGRYRAQTNASGGGDILDFDAPDNSTDIIGRLYRNSSGDIPPQVQNSTLVIYNTGQKSANAYNQKNTASNILAISDGNHDRLEFDLKQFPNRSPYQRFFLVDTKVRYTQSNDKLIRKWSQFGTSNWNHEALVTRHVQDAKFTYKPGTSSRSGLMTLKLTLEEEGEKVSLLHQVHVLNFP